MEARYSISTDIINGIVTVKMCGFWDEAIVADYIRDLNAAAVSLPCGPARHRAITDLSDFAIQTQAVFGAIKDYVQSAEPKAWRCALISGGGLAKMQFRRVVDPSYMAMFDDMDGARAWILLPENTP